MFQGPAEKPGIFIQSTKAGRLAREAGLRPGDQILLCNGVNFRHIEFGDAVFHLKSSRNLELVVKKRAGLDLFPSESSGYDSSTSSSVGDSPSDVRDLNHNKIKINVKPPDPPAISPTPQNTRNQEEAKRKLEMELEEQRKKLLSEQERLKKEAESLEEERKKFEEEKKLLRSTLSKSTLSASKSISNIHDLNVTDSTPSNTPRAPSTSNVNKSPSLSSSSGSSGTLATALQLEIKRRKQKAAGALSQGVVQPPAQAPSTPGAGAKKSPFITDKNDKHDMLIAEFKKAHKKMFTSSTDTSEESEPVKDVSESKTAPPPPPVRTLGSSLYSPSSSSDESLASKQVMADKTDTLLTVVNTHSKTVRKPAEGIPTPDYDSTPERSPPLHRKIFTKNTKNTEEKKIFTKNRTGLTQSKHITPPTVENIQRAKSLTALNKIEAEKEVGKTGKTRAPHAPPQPLRGADSLTDLRVSRPTQPPPSAPIGRPGSKNSQTLQPEFFKRHPELEMASMESFHTEQTQRPPSTYMDSMPRSSPSVSLTSYHSQSEPRRFEFLPKPCDPSKLPARQRGELARIASKDYRAVNNGTLPTNTAQIGELPRTMEKQKSTKAEKKIKELSEKTARSFGLKKAPAPLPPVLRK